AEKLKTPFASGSAGGPGTCDARLVAAVDPAALPAVTMTAMSVDRSSSTSLYASFVAPAIAARSRVHVYVSSLGAFIHVPADAAMDPPGTSVPQIAGSRMLIGASTPVETMTLFDACRVDPLALAAVTTQVIDPTSSPLSRWVAPIAPATGTPDRIHWNSWLAGDPDHVPAEHVSVSPTCGLP